MCPNRYLGLKKHQNTVVFPKKEIPDLEKKCPLVVLQVSIQTVELHKSQVCCKLRDTVTAQNLHKICFYLKTSPLEGSIEPAFAFITHTLHWQAGGVIYHYEKAGNFMVS